MRDFTGIDLSHESVPDATTLLKLRRLLLVNDLTKALLDEINAHVAGQGLLIHAAEQGLLIHAGAVVDATITEAPSSIKNVSNLRNLKMHQTKKRGAWHFEMKAHIGVDASSGLVHTVVT